MNEEKPMKEKIDILFDDLEKKQKGEDEVLTKKSRKFFKTPKKIKTGAKKKIKQNKILLLKVSPLGNIQPEWVKLQDNMVWNKDAGAYQVPHRKYIVQFMGKYPCMIVPEWSMKPFSPRKHMSDQTDTQKEEIFMQKFIIKVAKMEALDLKRKGLGNKNMIWIILGGIVALYMIMKALGLSV